MSTHRDPPFRPEDLGIGQLFDLVPDAVIAANAEDGRVVLWNPAAETIFGWSEAEMVGEPLDRIVPPELRERHRAGMARFRATGHGPLIDGGRPVTLPGLHRDGHGLTIELTLAPIARGPEGRFVLAIVRDVSDRQAAEEALRAAGRHKDEFLSVISHELRTPLNFIMGFGSILEDELAGPLNAVQHEYLGKMMEGSERMLVLINDLLDLAKIQAGRLALDLHPTPLDSLVSGVTTSLRPLAEAQGLALTADVDPELVAQADGGRVEQVLLNLVGNAIKFTPAGQVAVRAYPVDGVARVEVRDTGIGVEPGEQARIFEKFHQVDMTATRRAGGTGLGLSISKALVEAMGGAIGVASAPGEGSTFWFTLPLCQEPGC